MDLLAFAKNIADASRGRRRASKAPVAVCLIDIHGNVVPSFANCSSSHAERISKSK